MADQKPDTLQRVLPETQPAEDRSRIRLLVICSCVYLPLLAGILLLIPVYHETGIPIRYFFIDPVAEFNAPMYIGLLSNLGVLLWCATSSICLFSGWSLVALREQKQIGWFMVCAGLVTGVLMLDDLYLLHEEVLPDHLHIPQKLVFVGYGLMVLSFLIYFRSVILRTEYFILAVAFVMFAASVAIDLFVTPEEFYLAKNLPGRHLVEDGFKLLGIASWALYFIYTSVVQTIQSNPDRVRETSA